MKGIFRRLPAHYSQEAAIHALGTRWRVKRIEYSHNKMKRLGHEVPVTGTINAVPVAAVAAVAAPTTPATLEEGLATTSIFLYAFFQHHQCFFHFCYYLVICYYL